MRSLDLQSPSTFLMQGFSLQAKNWLYYGIHKNSGNRCFNAIVLNFFTFTLVVNCKLCQKCFKQITNKKKKERKQKVAFHILE